MIRSQDSAISVQERYFAFSGATCVITSWVVLCQREQNLHESSNLVLYIQIYLRPRNTEHENELNKTSAYKSLAFHVAIRHVSCML